MKAYDYWLADKYLEHVADDYILGLLHDKNMLDKVTDDLDLHITYRQLVWRDFESRSRQFKEYPGMKEHMLKLSQLVKDGQEDEALKLMEPKIKGFRGMKYQAHLGRQKWRK